MSVWKNITLHFHNIKCHDSIPLNLWKLLYVGRELNLYFTQINHMKTGSSTRMALEYRRIQIHVCALTMELEPGGD